MKKAYLVHGWDGTPDNWWFPWLTHELEKLDFKVISLNMPDSKIPRMKTWLSRAEKEIQADEDTIFIGHSIGCQTIMRYLANKNKKVKACFFVAGWFTLDLHLDTEEAKEVARPWLENNIDFNKLKNNCSNYIVFLSKDDPVVPFKENKELFEKNLNAKVIVENDRGHYDSEDEIPELLNEIIKLNSKTI